MPPKLLIASLNKLEMKQQQQEEEKEEEKTVNRRFAIFMPTA
jgi:hypothetical protein